MNALLALGVGHARIEDSVLDCWDVFRRGRRRRFELGNWQFDVDCADFVRAGVRREGWHWAQAGEVGGHGGCAHSTAGDSGRGHEFRGSCVCFLLYFQSINRSRRMEAEIQE